MIPRHRPPFGLLSLAGSTFRSLFDGRQISDLEHAYSQWLDVAHAVWIPSARYGIARTIHSQLPEQGTVYCPAFNCGAVFHSVQECHRTVRYIDCDADSFLMDTTVKPDAESAVVLSEVFGQRFSADQLAQPLAANADMRIFDMAMAIPTAVDMHRMRERDVTVLSFGLGKSLFTGWGGLAVTNSAEVANRLRQQCDRDLQRGNFRKRCTWNAKLWARTIAHHRLIYGPLRRNRRRSAETSQATNFCNTSHEWQRESTSLNRHLAFDNLRQADSWAQTRRELSDQYQNQLQPIASQVQLPEHSADALSHFSIRVDLTWRDDIIQQLWEAGIDVGTLFPFTQETYSRAKFPNAAKASAEVINLPLSNQLKATDIQQIANATIAAVKSCGSAENKPTIAHAA